MLYCGGDDRLPRKLVSQLGKSDKCTLLYSNSLGRSEVDSKS